MCNVINNKIRKGLRTGEKYLLEYHNPTLIDSYPFHLSQRRRRACRLQLPHHPLLLHIILHILHMDKGYVLILHNAILPYCHIYSHMFSCIFWNQSVQNGFNRCSKYLAAQSGLLEKRRIMNWIQPECANSITIRRITFNSTEEFMWLHKVRKFAN